MRRNEHRDKADAFWGEVLENDQVAAEHGWHEKI